ncbi:MAG TPA: OmpA family protein [Caulobacteraceae bacterium]|nr:OmpA family protein [Caulobacteraceae bacterium]
MTKALAKVLLPGLGGALLLAACAHNRNLVVVLPEANGHVGAVVVHAGQSQAVLDQAYAAAAPAPKSAHRLKAGALNAAKVKAIFGDALAALPVPPTSQSLFFENDSLTLTAQSAADLRALLDTVRTRKAVEIVVTGHTDTVGSDDYNDQLSRDRANAIMLTLLPTLKAYGVSADSVVAVGRGKRDLLVHTPDQTAEPRNRRVEITVR